MSYKLIKIHGTSGAGKTTVVNHLMNWSHTVDPIQAEGSNRIEAYRLRVPEVKDFVYVLGSYANKCGGMDTVSVIDDQIALIHKYAALGHVIYEGLLMSTYYGRLGKEVEQYRDRHIFAFLDTPMELCIERVKARRLEAGNTKPFNEDNTRMRQKAIDSVRRKATHLAYPVVTLRHDAPTNPQIIGLLK